MIFLAAMSMLTSPATAQHGVAQGSGLQRPEATVAVGITIPFGGDRRSEPARVELRMTRDMVQADGTRLSDVTGRTLRTSIGFALDRDLENRLLVNGRPMPGQDERKGISSAGWVAISVAGGASLIFGGLVIAQQLQGPTD